MNVLKEFKGVFEIDKAFYETFKECISTDTTRYFLGAVYFDSEASTFVATDGRKLIKHTTLNAYPDTPSGYYELAKIGKSYKMLPKDLDGNFPNWKRVIEQNNNYVCMQVEKIVNYNKTMVQFHSIKGNMAEDSSLIGEIILQNKTPINIDFITKVLKHVGDFEVMYNSDSETSPILFIIDQRTTYMIQPMKR